MVRTWTALTVVGWKVERNRSIGNKKDATVKNGVDRYESTGHCGFCTKEK
jgi:hypothetical protein